MFRLIIFNLYRIVIIPKWNGLQKNYIYFLYGFVHIQKIVKYVCCLRVSKQVNNFRKSKKFRNGFNLWTRIYCKLGEFQFFYEFIICTYLVTSGSVLIFFYLILYIRLCNFSCLIILLNFYTHFYESHI